MEVTGERHTPAALPPAKNPGTQSIGGYVGATKGLDVLERRKIPCPCRESICRPFSPSPGHNTDYTLQVLDAGRHDLYFSWPSSVSPDEHFPHRITEKKIRILTDHLLTNSYLFIIHVQLLFSLDIK
jgi:hypothetical protein